MKKMVAIKKPMGEIMDKPSSPRGRLKGILDMGDQQGLQALSLELGLDSQGMFMAKRAKRKSIIKGTRSRVKERVKSFCDYLLGMYDAPDFNEAMRSEVNFFHFLFEAKEIYQKIGTRKYLEILAIGIRVSNENAEYFLDNFRNLPPAIKSTKCFREIKENVETQLEKKTA